MMTICRLKNNAILESIMTHGRTLKEKTLQVKITEVMK